MPQTTITLSSEANGFAEEYAKKTGRTKSGFINWLISDFQNKLESKKDFQR